MRKKIGTAMVLGAGISGIRTALDLAEFGYRVTLVDKAPHMGGILSQLDYQFPNDGCGMCKMLPLVDRDAASNFCLRRGLFHENIDIVLGATLKSLAGEPGNFEVVLEQKPTGVDPDLCIGCEACTQVCPVEVADSFNLGLASRKAIYLPVPHNIPNTYAIDFPNCTRCGECVQACPTGAIRLPEERRKNFHILVVDDELIVRDSLKEWLADEGFSVDMAESGEKALGMLGEKEFHLMLTDIKMPGMDGVELLKEARGLYPDLTIVMMTAYATVETAVSAMKQGALDYLLKPFDPQTFTPRILEIYQTLDVVEEKELRVNALVLSTGTQYFDPKDSTNTFGYGVYPDVVTAREFERILSGTGPSQGQLLRQSDQKEVKKIAWFQCVGSRDLQTDSDFCSSVCCMHALKEARLVKEKFGPDVETTIFYMDLRTFGKSFFQYQQEAQMDYGIQFEKSRVHSVIENREKGGLQVRYLDPAGRRQEARYDMIVLSTGQRPSAGTARLADIAGLSLNPWGFLESLPFSGGRSNVEGIFLGGSATGLKDIGESVIEAGSAALCASRFIHSSGGSLSEESEALPVYRNVARELPRILVMACTCGGEKCPDPAALEKELTTDPAVKEVVFLDKACTRQGWEELISVAVESDANRILIGACLPYAFTSKVKDLAVKKGLHPGLIDLVDIRSPGSSGPDESRPDLKTAEILKTGFSRLKRLDPPDPPVASSVQKALVVGGGIGGMTAALAVADHGFEVDLIEKEAALGGNLTWLQKTIDGQDIPLLLEQTLEKIENHPRISVHPHTLVADSLGCAGHFITTLEGREDKSLTTLTHGAVILATGGKAPSTNSFAYGQGPGILTHKELEQGLAEGSLKPEEISSVVMIQCVDSRDAETKNYCSRICCTSTLKHALDLKEANPDMAVYVFYRDMMAYGFFETYYTRARQAGVLFIRYDPDRRPEVSADPSQVVVKAFEPVIGRDIEISADLLVLATGVSPVLPENLVKSFGAGIDSFGFFEAAESKWRPVDSLKEGVFACGLCHSPRNIAETVASAQSAAQRALRLLGDSRIRTGSLVSRVRHSLCSLCQRCIDTCPYGARTLDPDGRQINVNPVMCQGCGDCATVCPNNASVLAGFKDEQVFDLMDSFF
ncbi:response regulator [Desulfospira joergensenii]|uniref:response regulator n=1 Tax=Desulfospira joergensenii TaxID=53329 RepID=UPI0003B613CC|nr:response regulator [Desulfospira joergensenii]